MSIEVIESGQACGAEIRGVDLSKSLLDQDLADINQAWLRHHVLSFPDQELSDDDLERFTLNFGPFGDDPFIAPIAGRKHIIAVQRAADEVAPVFAEAWHTDWSFQKKPPIGTCLYGITIPPVGGDTLFINQHLVSSEMPDELRRRLEGLEAIHSAKLAYSPQGAYGEQDKGRSMDIRPSEDAGEIQKHPIFKPHTATGEAVVYGAAGYILGFAGLDEAESEALLMELYAWQDQSRFQYRHQWREKTLLMWDNRSVLHKATAGYDGHARYLHRTTIGAN
jgi:taurine dioxygenase